MGFFIVVYLDVCLYILGKKIEKYRGINLMNYENYDLKELLTAQSNLYTKIDNCRLSKRQLFDSKGILELLKIANKLVQNSLTLEQANDVIQKEIIKIQEDFFKLDLKQENLYQQLNEIDIAIKNKESE